jgi:hypothetical protein
MYYSELLRELGPIEVSRTADDTDPALIIWNDVNPAASYDIDTAAGNTLKLYNVGTTVLLSIDLTDTSSGYNKIGAVADLINAQAGWHCKIAAATRAYLTYASNTKLLAAAQASTPCYIAPGDPPLATCIAYWDTSRCTFRVGCIGMEELVTDFGNVPVPAALRTSEQTVPGMRHPVLGNVGSFAQPNAPTGVAKANRLDAAGVQTTNSGQTTSLIVTPCTQDSDGTPFTLFAGLASTTAKFLGAQELPREHVLTGPGERLVVQLLVTSTSAITSTQQFMLLGTIGIYGS